MTITPEVILKAKLPGDLYSPDADKMLEEFKSMAKKFHPDICKHPKSSEIMAIINDLYDTGVDMLKSNTWAASNLVRFPTIKGKTVEIRFYTSHPFELGTMYIIVNNGLKLCA
jgi:hypothetical protein